MKKRHDDFNCDFCSCIPEPKIKYVINSGPGPTGPTGPTGPAAINAYGTSETISSAAIVVPAETATVIPLAQVGPIFNMDDDTNVLIIEEAGIYIADAVLRGTNIGETAGLQFSITVNGSVAPFATINSIALADVEDILVISTLLELDAGDEVGLQLFSVDGLSFLPGPERSISLRLVKVDDLLPV